MKRIITRTILFIGYIILSYSIVMFFTAGGHGSYAPTAILYSWGIVPWQYGWVKEWFGFAQVPLYYLIVLFLLNTIFGISKKLIIQLIPLAFHIIGIVVAFIGMGHGDLNTPVILIISLAISLFLAILYFWGDFKIIRKAQHHN